MAFAFDQAYYPHLIDAIFAHLNHDGLQVAKRVSREWRRRANKEELYHLEVDGDLTVFSRRNGSRRPLIKLTWDEQRYLTYGIGRENHALSARLVEVFSQTSIVDFPTDWSAWAYAGLVAWLKTRTSHRPTITRIRFGICDANALFTLGGVHVYTADLGQRVADNGQFRSGIINIRCSPDRSLLDQDLFRILPQSATFAASDDAVVLIFHDAVRLKEEYPRAVRGKDGREIFISPTGEEIAEAIADWISYRWRKNPVVFVGLEEAFNLFQWAQVWPALCRLRDADERRLDHCADITSLTHEEYERQVGEGTYRIYTEGDLAQRKLLYYA